MVLIIEDMLYNSESELGVILNIQAKLYLITFYINYPLENGVRI
jgi:hypothetical protein